MAQVNLTPVNLNHARVIRTRKRAHGYRWTAFPVEQTDMKYSPKPSMWGLAGSTADGLVQSCSPLIQS